MLTDKFLLVADEDGDRIVQVDTETMTHQLPVIVTSQPQVLVYDWLRRQIYWTSGRYHYRGTIFKYSFASSETVEIYTNATSRRIRSFYFLYISTVEKIRQVLNLLLFTCVGKNIEECWAKDKD